MKRILCIMLSLALIICFGNALGEEFTVRNGLKWGETPEKVLESEGVEDFDITLPDQDGPTVERKKITDATVDGHAVEAIFGFKDGKLVSVEYKIPSRKDFNDIMSGLGAKYGRAYNLVYFGGTPFFENAQNMYNLYLGPSTAAILMKRLDYWWILDNGTIIAACSSQMYGTDPYVAYIDSAAFATE